MTQGFQLPAFGSICPDCACAGSESASDDTTASKHFCAVIRPPPGTSQLFGTRHRSTRRRADWDLLFEMLQSPSEFVCERYRWALNSAVTQFRFQTTGGLFSRSSGPCPIASGHRIRQHEVACEGLVDSEEGDDSLRRGRKSELSSALVRATTRMITCS